MQATASSCFTPELTDREFELLRQFIHSRSGISLNEHKRALVRARLGKRLRVLNLRNFSEYYTYLRNEDHDGSECIHMVDAISTNLTRFFRESEHFDYLRAVVFPRFQRLSQIRILSAGCSTGEEPYTIAIAALEHFGPAAGAKVEITAVDISSQVVAQACEGIYTAERVRLLPPGMIDKYFVRGVGVNRGFFRVKGSVQALVRFGRVNLMDDFRFESNFHAIFCRNVAIYFNRETQRALAARFHRALVPGGTLFVGHSESLLSSGRQFRYVQPAVYEREGA